MTADEGGVTPTPRKRLEPNLGPRICSGCSDPGTRQLGFDWWCDDCHETLLAPIRQRVIARQGAIDTIRRNGDPFGGHGRQDGPIRHDYGPDWADLRCDRCGAGWVGRINEPCDWCARSYELLLEVQRSVLLNPDLPHPEAAERRRAETAWAERLGRAVKAGLLDRKTARVALERELAKSGS